MAGGQEAESGGPKQEKSAEPEICICNCTSLPSLVARLPSLVCSAASLAAPLPLYPAPPQHRGTWHAARTAGTAGAVSVPTGTNPAPPAPAGGAGQEAVDGGANELRESSLVPTSARIHLVSPIP